MKFPINGLVVSFLLAVQTNARFAHVYLSGLNATSSASRRDIVPPSTARLILAQRLDLTDFHSLEGTDENAFASLNAYGVNQRRLFGDEESRPSRAVVLVEDVEDLEDIHSKCLVKPFFAIENPPSPSQNKKLFKDLHRQNEHKQAICSSNKGSSLRIKHEGKKSSALDRCQLLESCSLSIYLCKPRARSYPLICNSPKSSHANSRRKQSLHHHHIGLMLSTLDHLHVQAIHYNIELTTILMPPITPPKSAGLFRRSNTPPSTWGSYILLPRAASPQEPEQETPEDQDLPSEPRPGSESEPQTESESEPEAEPGAEPGSEPDSDTPPLARPIIGGIIDDLQSAGQEEQEEPPSPSAAQDEPRPSASPPVGILPVCYTSQSDCDATTHACSGHGACVQKYSYPEGGSSNINNTCFACRCDVDTNENRQGQRVTTQWAGPACQKQDVSSAFWLLGGFSVVLVSVIAWAVGLLISMGNEELPSVIGAGVAGPRAR